MQHGYGDEKGCLFQRVLQSRGVSIKNDWFYMSMEIKRNSFGKPNIFEKNGINAGIENNA